MKLIGIDEALDHIEKRGGGRITKETLRSWYDGSRPGRQLEIRRVGKFVKTTEAWIDQFLFGAAYVVNDGIDQVAQGETTPK